MEEKKISSKLKITHIITGLNLGGAETMLFNVLKHMDRDKFEAQVISLTDEGFYGKKIKEELGISVSVCNLKQKNIFKSLKQCLDLCKQTDVIQSWMYHSNLVGFFIAKVLKKRIVWGIHHSNLNPSENKKMTVWIAKFSALLSRHVDKIISCGKNVRKIHVQIGYSEKNHEVVVNGFDIKKFNVLAKKDYYIENFSEIDDNHIIIHVGRWDPLKDYDNLLRAMSILKDRRSDFLLFMVGTNLDYQNIALNETIVELGLKEKIRLLGRRTDIPQLMGAADLFVLSSSGEGLPNVLGEALASGTCCVTTDVGDCANLVGESGEIVPAKNPEELSQAIENVLDWDSETYDSKAQCGRAKIERDYEIGNVVNQYEDIYQNILN